MKKIAIFFLITIAISSKRCYSQITLEQTYPSAGWYNLKPTPNAAFGAKLFYLVKLEISGEKYVSIDLIGQNVSFYNLNHSLYATMSYSNVTLLGGLLSPNDEKFSAGLLYFSELLFDTDNQIEMMYTQTTSSSGTPLAITQIVNQDGSLLFTANGEAPIVKPTQHNQYYPIYNTANGTKMILSKTDGTAKVYALGGTFTAIIANNPVIGDNNTLSLSPNPLGKSAALTLKYNLPVGVNSADLHIFDTTGKEVRSYKVGSEMHEVLLEPGELPAGVYYYQLSSGSKIIGTKTSIVID